MKLGLWNLIVSFVVSILIAPIIIRWLRKLKFGQSILVYVEQHKTKSGTATMGGIIFILSTIITAMFFIKKDNMLSIICLLGFLAFGVLGFLDDFIKIVLKRNKGLSAKQKMFLQVLVAVLFLFLGIKFSVISTDVLIPILNINIKMGWFYIIFATVLICGFVNSVNLTDGLDGLATSVTAIVTLTLSLLSVKLLNYDMALVSAVVFSSCLGFLVYNRYPAKVFMGDTGSLFLGGAISVISIMLKMEWVLFTAGLIYFIEALSVMIQVAVYKKYKKRVFLMSPIHHHFEMKGWKETKIVAVFSTFTAVMCILTVIISFI